MTRNVPDNFDSIPFLRLWFFSEILQKTRGHKFFFFSPKATKNSSFLPLFAFSAAATFFFFLLIPCMLPVSFLLKKSFFFLPSNLFFYSISVFPKENFPFSYQKNMPLSFLQNYGDPPSKQLIARLLMPKKPRNMI